MEEEKSGKGLTNCTEEGLLFGQSIIGHKLEDGWVVDRFDRKRDNDTGRAYSLCYIVSRQLDGEVLEEGYMKVFNLVRYNNEVGDNRIKAVNRMSADYLYEQTLLDSCRDAHLEQVCFAIAHGDLEIEVAPGISLPTPYFIFPKAIGDLQRYIHEPEDSKEKQWRLRVAHKVSVALTQLYTVGIWHQDIKPSNVLRFSSTEKLSDLGRSFSSNQFCHFEADSFWGDQNYHSPEVAYKDTPTDRKLRAAYTDLYLLGSFIYHLFTGCTINSAIYNKMPSQMHPLQPDVSYEDALPLLQNAHAECMKEFAKEIQLPEQIKLDLVELVKGLTEPDYKRRGNPNVTGERFVYRNHLDRNVTVLDKLYQNALVNDK